MDIRDKDYDELYEIARFYNLFIPPGLTRKNLENLIYKNINLKILSFRLVLLIDIVVQNGKNISGYIDSMLPAFPEIFLGKILYNHKNKHLFENYAIAKINTKTLRIDLQKSFPFSEEDIFQISEHFRKLEKRIEVNNFFNPDKESIQLYNLDENVNLKFKLKIIKKIAL
jgi:hypothetical protein